MVIMMAFSLLCAGLLIVVRLQRRECRRLRAYADELIMRYGESEARLETLVLETSKCGGVLYDLIEVEQLTVLVSQLPDCNDREVADRILKRLHWRMCRLMKQVADRYHLSAENKQRWLVDGTGRPVTEGQ
ncbi:hypothetical protein OQ483_25105 (plasmid) [Enterobacter bugandensis]|uniref:hypothetical protein n=1 Tax=Enterobacter bugandensis TaxID=881260 RepID=UPI000FACC8D0|nr:hypothetical protein [Enterobacter bugandensis]EBP3773453.1 hypothetical protein [Salmonella enterica subsp. arizonae]ECD8868985.1 hypothetical protein [Salmonella enterica]MIH92518.1 hypothetical protein [Salmonella enterica subsp. arizonae]WMU75374.1 hypothetical protein OQ483_25105 [Enterobacter bugandensis]